jgi:hypothetical protein
MQLSCDFTDKTPARWEWCFAGLHIQAPRLPGTMPSPMSTSFTGDGVMSTPSTPRGPLSTCHAAMLDDAGLFPPRLFRFSQPLRMPRCHRLGCPDTADPILWSGSWFYGDVAQMSSDSVQGSYCSARHPQHSHWVG